MKSLRVAIEEASDNHLLLRVRKIILPDLLHEHLMLLLLCEVLLRQIGALRHYLISGSLLGCLLRWELTLRLDILGFLERLIDDDILPN